MKKNILNLTLATLAALTLTIGCSKSDSGGGGGGGGPATGGKITPANLDLKKYPNVPNTPNGSWLQEAQQNGAVQVSLRLYINKSEIVIRLTCVDAQSGDVLVDDAGFSAATFGDKKIQLSASIPLGNDKCGGTIPAGEHVFKMNGSNSLTVGEGEKAEHYQRTNESPEQKPEDVITQPGGPQPIKQSVSVYTQSNCAGAAIVLTQLTRQECTAKVGNKNILSIKNEGQGCQDTGGQVLTGAEFCSYFQ